MDYQDQTITCRDCNNEFVWSAGEQEFYASKGLSAPTRCKECRMKKRQDQQGRDGRFGGSKRFPPKMYPITCSNCGKAGEVPFEPKTDQVLCKECFMEKRNSEQN